VFDAAFDAAAAKVAERADDDAPEEQAEPPTGIAERVFSRTAQSSALIGAGGAPAAHARGSSREGAGALAGDAGDSRPEVETPTLAGGAFDAEASHAIVEEDPAPSPLHAASVGLPDGMRGAHGSPSASFGGRDGATRPPPWCSGAPVEASPSMSSSDESSFAGFIEDPLEKERPGEVQIWLGGRPCQSPAPLQPPFRGEEGESPILVENVAGDIEEVKPDRSAF